MASSARVPMVRLTAVHGTFAAHVLAARLTDEGFDVELRGALANPYALTVGDFARVDVYVPEDQVAEASIVLLVGEVDETLDLPEPRRPIGPVTRVAVGMVAAAALAPLVVRLVTYH